MLKPSEILTSVEETGNKSPKKKKRQDSRRHDNYLQISERQSDEVGIIAGI